jgi:hypothetical protein
MMAWLAVGPVAPADPQIQTVTLIWDGRAKVCGAQVNSAEISDTGDEAGRTALLRALPDKSKVVRLSGATETPYKCVGDLVTLLQHEGYRLKIGFGADPSQR